MNDINQTVFLRFCFSQGAFITRSMPLHRANEIIVKWTKGYYHESRDRRFIGDTTVMLQGYTVDMQSVVFMDIVTLEQMQGTQQQIPINATPMFSGHQMR